MVAPPIWQLVVLALAAVISAADRPPGSPANSTDDSTSSTPSPDPQDIHFIREHSSHADEWFPQAEHVVRLHRLDGSGEASMLEAEERWKRGEHVAASSFVELPQVQFEMLKKHRDYRRRTDARNSSFLQTATPADSTDSNGVTPLDFKGSQYIGPLAIGTEFHGNCSSNEDVQKLRYVPRQDLDNASSVLQTSGQTCFATAVAEQNAIFDTGSTNTWVQSAKCEDPLCKRGWGESLDTRKSKSFIPGNNTNVSVHFVTGQMAGQMIKENIHVGNITWSNQAVGLIQTKSGRVFEDMEFKAIVGMAFSGLLNTKGLPEGELSFMDNMIKEKQLKNNMVSFYFSQADPAKNALLWGGVDKRLYEGNLEAIKIFEPYYWSLKLKDFKIGGQSMLETGRESSADRQSPHVHPKKVDTRLVVDTGTSLFSYDEGMEPQIVDKLKDVPCSQVTSESHPDITFTLQNTKGEDVHLTFANSAYMVKNTQNPPFCQLGFMRASIPGGPGMIFGDLGMREYYTVFNRNGGAEDDATVHFALSAKGVEAAKAIAELTANQKAFVR